MFRIRTLLAAVCLCFATAQAQTVAIPDANFVTALTNFFPSCMNGNLLDTTCVQVVSATGLSLYGKNISNFEGLQYFDNVVTLDISQNPATSLSVLPRILQELTAENIPLTSIPALPSTMTKLTMKNNFLTTLPALPAGMFDLWVEANDLTGLPALPAGLFSLQVHHNNITSLPALPASLNVLNVYNNQISSIPTLPATLSHLNFSVNQVSVMPVLPANLQYLDMSNNMITALPASLPPNLVQFLCGGNLLTSLPATLPAGLWNFACGYNSITSMPALPASITHFYCQDNQLTSLPTLPPNLLFLFCANNQLTSLPALPSSMFNVNCPGNQISCFPILPSNAILTLFPNPAVCLPNYTSQMSPTDLAYPLCVVGNSSINPSGCMDGIGIYGTIFDDNNSSCLYDNGETPFRNVPVELRDAGNTLLQRGFSTTTGAYFLSALAGSYTVTADTAGMPWVQTNCAGGTSRSVTLTTPSPVANGVDIEADCGAADDFGVQSIVHGGLAFPGTTHSLHVTGGDLSQWFGFNCGSGASGQITLTIMGPVTYAGTLPGAQTPSISGITYTYTVADFGTWDFYNGIGLLLSTDTTAQATDIVCVTANLTTSANDVNQSNNAMYQCYPVVNSMDPNIKESYPTYETDPQGYITYTIHFQNNGTAPARLVKLSDTLDTDLDWSTFEPTGYSHFCEVNLNGNVLNVRYPNINLMDSATNYAASQGYFQYRVKPYPTSVMYTLIENKADIYFDFNAPITTNTTTNWLNFEIGFEESSDVRISVGPNPSEGVFHLQSSYQGSMALSVRNMLGQEVWRGKALSGNAEIDLGIAPKGVYLLEANANGKPLTHQRLIKQ